VLLAAIYKSVRLSNLHSHMNWKKDAATSGKPTSRKRKHEPLGHAFETPSSVHVDRLPVHDVRDQILDEIRNNRVTVIVGETGSGKTTQIPQFILRANICGMGRAIGVTQPRRVAAISVATRVAQEMNVQLGQVQLTTENHLCSPSINTTQHNTTQQNTKQNKTKTTGSRIHHPL
jgi:HrpA-like RNA helicase